MTFKLTPVQDNAFNAFKVTVFDALRVVEKVRQTVASLDVEVHVALDFAVFFHVGRKESETEI